jgi:hypothetical protein
VFAFLFSSLLFAQPNNDKTSTQTKTKKLNYSFYLSVGGIRIDEKYSWDSVRKINFGAGLNINYKNIVSNEITYKANPSEYKTLYTSISSIYGNKGHGFSYFHGIYKFGYEFFLKNTVGFKLEKEGINEEIYSNLRFINAPFSIRYINRKALLCYMIKIKEYQFLMRTGISKTNYVQGFLKGYYPTGELYVEGYVLNKIGFVFAPEFRSPIIKRFQAKASIEWMIFPAKIPNLFEANVGIIYNMQRIKNASKR